MAQVRAAGGGRNDLLTQGAGLGVGAWSVNPGLPTDLLAADLLLVSIEHPDLDVLTHWIGEGQQRGLSGARHRA